MVCEQLAPSPLPLDNTLSRHAWLHGLVIFIFCFSRTFKVLLMAMLLTYVQSTLNGYVTHVRSKYS